MGPIERIGYWLDFCVGYIPDTHIDIIPYEHLKPRILENKGVAKGWLFIDAHREYINVRDGTLQNEQLQVVASDEATGTKVKYYLTDEDKQSAMQFAKHVMRYRLDEVYDKRIIQQRMNVSDLEYDSWAQQKSEAEAYIADNTASVPLLSQLATARGITVAEMAQKVVDAIAAYNVKIEELLSKKQAIETEIKACVSIADCARLLHHRFHVQMSKSQMDDEGITTQSTFDI
jgi:hypothetical protein